jgi:hypothetical protein
MTIQTFKRGGYTLTLDSSEIVPGNPGEGTPAMVEGPKGTSGTFFCVIDTGEMIDGDYSHPVPAGILKWLESMTETVDAFIDSHS